MFCVELICVTGKTTQTLRTKKDPYLTSGLSSPVKNCNSFQLIPRIVLRIWNISRIFNKHQKDLFNKALHPESNGVIELNGSAIDCCW